MSVDVLPGDSAEYSIAFLGIEIWNSNPNPGYEVVFSIEGTHLATLYTTTGELTCAKAPASHAV